jgi:putative sterol carrier protein
MEEVTVIGEDLNGLGWTIKSLMDQNLGKPGVYEKVRKIKGSLVVRETGADVAVTVLFLQGRFQIKNEVIDRPSAYLAASFEHLSELTSGQVHPIKALLTGKIKARGNLIKLLKMARAVISRE